MRILYLYWCIFFLTSCFKVEIDYDLDKDFVPEISVGASINVQDSIHYIHLSQTTLGDFQNVEIEGATVYIEIKSKKYYFHQTDIDYIGRLNYGTHYANTENLEIDKGDTCRLFIEHPQYKTVSSTSIYFDANELKEYRLNCGLDLFSVTIADEGGADYYALDLYYYDRNERVPLNFETTDPSANDFYDTGRRVLIDDSFFDTQDKTISFTVDDCDDSLKYEIEWYTISEEMYLYEKSARLQEESRRNPYLPRPLIRNNIINGKGIFSIEHRITYQLN